MHVAAMLTSNASLPSDSGWLLRETGCLTRHSAPVPLSTVDVKPKKVRHGVDGAQLLSAMRELQPIAIPSGSAAHMMDAANRLIAENGFEDNFYIVDIAHVIRLHKAWTRAMPRVRPFYAVKCCPQPGILRVLAALGAGFDCASKAEMHAVLQLGVSPSRIIFANPCKRPVDLKFAAQCGVKAMTFDTHAEIDKIAAAMPTADLVLRIRADDPTAIVQLGAKYGCNVVADDGSGCEARALLRHAAALGMNVVGVSFHVGSGCKNLNAYDAAITIARKVFDMAAEMGFSMTLLDIGGGFSGRFDANGHISKLGELSSMVNTAVAAHFPHASNVTIIAEPGRYFAEAAMWLATMIIGRRTRSSHDGSDSVEYWITDGLYGSMNCMLYDFSDANAVPIRQHKHSMPSQNGSMLNGNAGDGLERVAHVWGPTCDGMDCVFKDVELPALTTGDWLLFTNFGAYTWAGASSFNGIEADDPKFCYVLSRFAVDAAEDEDIYKYLESEFGIDARQVLRMDWVEDGGGSDGSNNEASIAIHARRTDLDLLKMQH